MQEFCQSHHMAFFFWWTYIYPCQLFLMSQSKAYGIYHLIEWLKNVCSPMSKDGRFEIASFQWLLPL